jgi:hypothetical protein
MTSRTRALATALGLACTLHASAQQAGDTVPPSHVTVTRAPSERYAAGWLHRVFFGDHWRDAWTTPVEIEVLDIATFAGGLRPIKRGGGFQTRSLRFQGGDGRKYKFRSLDKDPTKVLPKELQESIAADIVQDQISTSNPFAPFVVAPLLNAVGVLNAPPRLVLLPDDPGLGEHRAEFGGLLGILEEHPDTRDDGEPGFGGADKVESTLDLFARLEKRNDEWPDSRAYLTARLMDVFLGDWDRHTDQWLWARVEEGGRQIWKPIPRDRDQAFARYDGVMPWIASQAVAQLEGFSDDYPKIADLTWSGRHIDRRFLVSLERSTWDSITAGVVAALTDSVIAAAVRQLPAAIYALDGEALQRDLIARRDRLSDASRDFYDNLAKAVDVRGSKEDEVATIERFDDRHVRVALYDRADGALGHLVFARTFDADETRELRLYLGDGDDSVAVSGSVASSILVRIVGGDGADVLVDRSRVDGYALGLIPFIPDAETTTLFYDDGKKTRAELGASASLVQGGLREPKNPAERYEPLVPDIGHDWRFAPWFTYNSDLGLFLGGGPILYEHGFQADPYVYRMSLVAGYATGARTYRAQFDGDFRDVIGDARLVVLARASGLEVQNFFGLGNESARSPSLESADYYEVRQRQFTFQPSIGIPLFDGAELSIAAGVTHSTTVDGEGLRLVTTTSPYGTAPLTLAHASLGLRVDTRDVAANASSGVLLDVRGEFYPKVIDAAESFGKLRAEARTYLGVDWPLQTTLALRAAGEQNLGGAYPFFKAAFLGGAGSLRGFESERFAGNASLVGNAELRLGLVRFNVLFPGTLGVSAAIESGRVFSEGEISERWHTAYGGGAYVTLVDRAITMSVSAMQSPEKLGIYVSGGFGF